jgi:hypothetical protein
MGDNIKTGLEETELQVLDWIRWAQDSNQWPVFKHGIASSYFLND